MFLPKSDNKKTIPLVSKLESSINGPIKLYYLNLNISRL